MRPRSLLFVPANQPRFLPKAAACRADAVILDLEDSVAGNAKTQARAALSSAIKQLSQQDCRVWVRINAIAESGMADLEALAGTDVEAVLVPKVHGADDLPRRMDLGDGVSLVATIEDAIGLWKMRDVLSPHPERTLSGLAFGSEDFATSMGISPTADALELPAQLIAMAAAAHDLPAYGVVGSIADIDPVARFEKACRRAKTVGFSGAMCIHPNQVRVANAAFNPSESEVAEAKSILEAVGGNDAVVAVSGTMIDRPVVERARATLRRAGISL